MDKPWNDRYVSLISNKNKTPIGKHNETPIGKHNEILRDRHNISLLISSVFKQIKSSENPTNLLIRLN